MKANGVLQIIFAFFLGLVVVAFVGIGVNTFYPQPEYPSSVSGQAVWEATYNQWALVTGITLLVVATVILAVSLFLPEDQAVLSNGILLGGVFTMLYAVGMTFSTDTSLLRFGVVAVALAVTIVIGYLKFVRGHHGLGTISPGASQQSVPSGEVEERLAAVERKIDALGRALRD